MKKNKIKIFKKAICASGVFVFAFFAFFILSHTYYFGSTVEHYLNQATVAKGFSQAKPEIVSHIQTPKPVKAIYMTSWVAGEKSIRNRLVDLIDNTELNSVVIDIKDYTGKIAFETQNKKLRKYNAFENRIPDIKEFLEHLHNKDIYVIGRVSVFQDPHFVKQRPDLAVKITKNGAIWRDYKGLSWLDPGSIEVWNYMITLAQEAYQIGFDEINFDYVRFPSDGDMTQIYYPLSEDRVISDPDKGKSKILREFFVYLDNSLKNTDAVLSVDLFGMTTTNGDDLNIGQILEDALLSFDFVAPMVYPSHYPNDFIGLANPAEHPYEVVKYSMDCAVEKARRASTTPNKLRPWLQDFDLGADYTAEMVRAQIQAVYDAGLNGWMLWSAANRYTKDALKLE